MVLIDQQPLAGKGVAAGLRAQPGFHVLAFSARIEEALQQVRETRPDVVLLNLRLESRDGLTLAGALHANAGNAVPVNAWLTPL